MKLRDVVEAIVVKKDVSDKDIEATVLFLMQDNILNDVKVFRRIMKKLNADLEYEDTPLGG